MRRPFATHNTYDDAEDVDYVDFSNAVLYIAALQNITSVVIAAASTVACCSLLPPPAVSSVRTVVVSSCFGALVMKKPFTLGNVHGLLLVFRALQPCVVFYMIALVAEQLVHSCARDVEAPSWRRLVFNLSVVLMVVSGFMRARRPLANTDGPFLMTVTALFIAALLPPPAVLMAGPLCSSPTLYVAAERLVRAFVFALNYSVFVFAAAPPAQSSGEVFVCVTRAFAATVWLLACHVWVLPLAFVQAGVVVYVRMFSSEYSVDDEVYAEVPQKEPPPDLEACAAPIGPVAPTAATVAPQPDEENSHLVVPSFQPLGQRGLVDIGSAGTGSCLTQAEIAAIANRIE